MENTGGVVKWKRGLSKLRRRSSAAEVSLSPEFTSIMEENEDTTEQEMQNYLASLKRKTGLNMIWSGRKFNQTIDRDPEVDMSEPLSAIKSSLKDLTLDSDEEDLHKFITNLTDDEDEVTRSDKENKESSDDELDLMKNINFAEAMGGNYDVSFDTEVNDNDDYLPRIVRPNFQDDASDDNEEQESHSSGSRGIFKNNIKILDSNEIDSAATSSASTSIKSVIHRTVSGPADEEIEEHLSRTISPTKSNDYNYTESRFDSYETGASHDVSYRSQSDHDIGRQSSSSGSRSTMTTESSVNSTTSSKTSVKASPYGNVHRNGNDKKKKSSKDTSSSSLTSLSSSSRSSKSRDKNNNKKPKNKDKTIFNRQSPRMKNSSTQTKLNSDRIQSELLLEQHRYLRKDVTSKYLDPSPIATTVVSSDALEAVTSYDPSVLALNDLLKYQLQLTRQHIDNSWRLYNAYTMPDNARKHKYTTLKDTLRYMKKKGPSVITYEEALKEIQNEDN
eukprot:gene6272-6993_t